MTLGTLPQDFNPNSLPFNDPAQTRKVALITGGNSGLGFFTSLHLYTHGWEVYVAARNPTKANDAIKKIKSEAESRKSDLPAIAVFGELHFTQLDLSSLAKTKKGVDEFLSKESQLNLLINNAGVMALPIEITDDQLDIQIQTNHISPFYLTLNLLPLLKKSEFGPRIVFLSSLGHQITDNPKDFGKLYNYIPTFISGMLRYGNSKLANIQTAKALALRYPSILSVAVHPGVCCQTNLLSYWRNLPYIGYVASITVDTINHYIGISNEQGSYNTLFVALSPEVTTQENNGDYFTPVGFVTQPSAIASDPEKIQQTWDWTVTQLVDRGFLSPEEAQKLNGSKPSSSDSADTIPSSATESSASAPSSSSSATTV
ncbi:uncharacterized protein SAPINGB_P005081 [Magnusiomyces paraingens]|uniref:NAD(P)-binding protein n=1 Tax=Magnusiomyces paraingens TaxID=2606893 RepID=A0A5E8BZE0_9ASCO|nr:uncharacterized protein SAPINGB_P005081 [Saprochaete ingens]VVT56472.1 unnamed protein product [Saprochaete ingens]